MAHFLLTYDLAPDYLARREAWREAHLAHAWAAVDRGELLLGGACEDGQQAFLVFTGDSPAAAEAFAAADPYVVHGVVTGWRTGRWNTVVGPLAAAPLLRP